MADSPISSLPAVENLPNGQPNIETDDLFVLEHPVDGQRRACKVSGEQVTKFISRNVQSYGANIVASDAAGGADYNSTTGKLTLNLPHGPGIKRVDPPSNPGQPGAIDTYTLIGEDVALSDPDYRIEPGGPVGTFSVYNGMDGTGTVNTVANVPPNASTHDVPKASLINALADDLFDMFWPIGSIYSSKTASVNPGANNGVFKRGTWVQITDHFIYAAGTKGINATGGSETQTADFTGMAHIAIYNQAQNYYLIMDPKTDDESDVINTYTRYSKMSDFHTGSWDDTSTGGHYGTKVTGTTDSFDNMPPFEVAYMWKRTA